MTPPPGGDVNRGPSMLGVAWGTTLFAFVFFCFRMYARIRIIHRFDAADYALVCAMVSADFVSCLIFPLTRSGAGFCGCCSQYSGGPRWLRPTYLLPDARARCHGKQVQLPCDTFPGFQRVVLQDLHLCYIDAYQHQDLG